MNKNNLHHLQCTTFVLLISFYSRFKKQTAFGKAISHVPCDCRNKPECFTKKCESGHITPFLKNKLKQVYGFCKICPWEPVAENAPFNILHYFHRLSSYKMTQSCSNWLCLEFGENGKNHRQLSYCEKHRSLYEKVNICIYMSVVIKSVCFLVAHTKPP